MWVYLRWLAPRTLDLENIYKISLKSLSKTQNFPPPAEGPPAAPAAGQITIYQKTHPLLAPYRSRTLYRWAGGLLSPPYATLARVWHT
jgi:hypothetical protein